MYMKILLNYFIGYVKISVEGYFVERFINLCISHHLLLWNSKRKQATLLHTCISIQDFKKLSRIAKQTKCKIKIEEKNELEKEIDLIKNIIKTREELKQDNKNYEYAEMELIDYYIYQIKANQAKLDYLLKMAKAKGISIDNISQIEYETDREEIG